MSSDSVYTNGHDRRVADTERLAKRRRAITHTRPRDQQIQQNTENIDTKTPRSESRVAFAELASAVTGRDVPRTNDMVRSANLILDEFQELRETVRDHEEFMDSYGVEKPRDRDEAWTQILQAARNKQDNPDHTISGTNEVALYVNTIETATGYSDRHCSSLIDEYSDEKRGTRKVEYQPPSAATNNSARKKQLVVDLDVWGDPS